MTTRREFLSLGAALGAAFPIQVAHPEGGEPGRIVMEQDERWEVRGYGVLKPHLLHVEFDVDVESCLFRSRERTYGSGRPQTWVIPGWEAEDASEVWEKAATVMERAADLGSWHLYVIRVDSPSFTRYHVCAIEEGGLTSRDMAWVVPSSVIFRGVQ